MQNLLAINSLSISTKHTENKKSPRRGFFSKQVKISHLYNLLTLNEQHEVTAQYNQKAVHNL